MKEVKITDIYAVRGVNESNSCRVYLIGAETANDAAVIWNDLLSVFDGESVEEVDVYEISTRTTIKIKDIEGVKNE